MDVRAEGLMLCRDAVEMIAALHLTERVALAELDALAAAGQPDPAACARMAASPPAQLALHLTDEEEDMFPMLRRRAAPEDDLDATLARLSREHAELAAAADAEGFGHHPVRPLRRRARELRGSRPRPCRPLGRADPQAGRAPHAEHLERLGADEARRNRLAELNLQDGVGRLAETPILRAAWRGGAPVRIHGMIYGVRDGLLRDLDCTIDPAGAPCAAATEA